MENDLQTAANLRRAQQQTVHRSNFPKEVHEKQLKEKMKHYKSRLVAALTQKDKEAMVEALKKLFEIRAEQFTLKIQKSNGQMIENERVIEQEMKKYYEDCYRLKIRFQPFLNN